MSEVKSNLEDAKKKLIQKIKESSKEADDLACFSKKRAFLITLSTAVMAAAITVLAGWKWALPQWGVIKDNVILILGGAIAILNAWTAFFRYRDVWLSSVIVTDRLNMLLSKVELLSERAQFDDAAFLQLFDEYQSMLGDYNKKWADVVNQAQPASKLVQGGE